jgi:tetratricopeptide (TPR) repeat protein
MDWGLAKVLGASPEEPADPEATTAPTAMVSLRESDEAYTRAGSVLGTPPYMPPEQAAGAVAVIDRRSDVFGLGAVLAVVLTGKPPFVAGTAEATRARAALGDVGECFARLDRCGAEADLVALCKHCLAPRPEDRPADAGEVAVAVAGLRAAAEERARRSAERRKQLRILLAASGAIVLALLAGLSVSLWQMRQARQERDAKALALAAEQRAREDETKAREQAFAALRSMTADVVERKFAQVEVLTEDDRAFFRGIIAQFDAFAAIKGDDADSRAVRAEGRLRVGDMRYRLGELKDAEQDYDQALSIYQQLATDFPSRPEFRRELARSRQKRSWLLIRTGRPKEAEQEIDQALSIQKQLAAEYPSRPEYRQDVAMSYLGRGLWLPRMGRMQEVEQDYDQALSIQKQLATDFPSRTEFRWALATIYRDRGNLLSDMGRLQDAEKEFDQDLSINKQLAADFPTQAKFRQALAWSHGARGNLLKNTGRLKEAEQDYDQALSIQKQLATDFPNWTVLRNELGRTCVDLALLHSQQGGWSAAKRLLLEGRRHHLAALKANPRNPRYRQFYGNHLVALTTAHAGLLEPEDAVRTAETYRNLGWDAPADAYNAACALSLCIPIVAKHANLDEKQRKEAARFYGDAAMKFLRDAVSKGYGDVAHLKKDTDLDPLRPREDFQKLIAQLQGKGK